jgi:hypothetical protein
MSKPKPNVRELVNKLLVNVQKLRRYSIVAFLVLLAALYGSILFRINNLSNAQPSSDAVSSQVQASRVLRIDQSVVKQLQSLQDNSVSVKTLFDQARANPFQE